MVTRDKVINGLSRYIDAEIASKMAGWQKFVFATSAGIIMSKSDSLMQEIAKNPIVSALGIVSDNGEIDIDTIYREAQKQAQNCGAFTVSIPLIGNITLSASDIDTAYRYIMQ